MTGMKDIFGQLYQEVSPTIVTVRDTGMEGCYGTGFVLLSEKGYSLIFTSASIVSSKQELVVYFGEDFPRIAKVLCLQPEMPFAILIVESDDQCKAITFSEDPAKRQLTTTIGAISCEGVLGNFKGFVFTPSCAAFDDSGQPLVGSEDYFLLKCTFQDEMDNNTEMLYTELLYKADKLISAPVFDLNGTVIGLVASADTCSDVKIGLHTKAIYNYLKKLCGGAEWKKLLKGLAEHFCNKERGTRKREHDDGAEGSKPQRQS